MNFLTITNWFGGRSTFFAFWFFVGGAILAFAGKPMTGYVALAGGLQTILVARAIADDYHERQKANGMQNMKAPSS